MTTKLFNFAGVSTFKGTVNVRYANEKHRAKTLLRNGHTNVLFVTLEDASRQEDCIDVLMRTAFVLNDAATKTAVWKEAARLKMLPDSVLAEMKTATAEETVDAEAEEVAEEVEQAVEAAFEAAEEAVSTEKTLSMTPSAIKKREARAKAKAEKEMA
jgi:hypothetical protein